MASAPRLILDASAGAEFATITGEIPSPLSPPPGCHFHPRCPIAEPHCRATAPGLVDTGRGQRVACFLADRPPG
jgi:peptide/nickel transport system ATP-binding protein